MVLASIASLFYFASRGLTCRGRLSIFHEGVGKHVGFYRRADEGNTYLFWTASADALLDEGRQRGEKFGAVGWPVAVGQNVIHFDETSNDANAVDAFDRHSAELLGHA